MHALKDLFFCSGIWIPVPINSLFVPLLDVCTKLVLMD
jgi:hypothetical protein